MIHIENLNDDSRITVIKKKAGAVN